MLGTTMHANVACANHIPNHTTHCNTPQHTATYCNILQHTVFQTVRNTLHHTATHCNTLQHTSTHCNPLQHTLHLKPHAILSYSRPIQLCWSFSQYHNTQPPSPTKKKRTHVENIQGKLHLTNMMVGAKELCVFIFYGNVE